MEDIWTPWRMRYIEASRATTDCVFCEKPSEPDGQLILHRGPLTFTILNLYPYGVGHLMVIPYRHLSRLGLLSPEERDEMAVRLRQAEGVLRRIAGARGFHAGMNLGRAAGAGVDGHLHAHLVPRGLASSWAGESRGEELPVRVEETWKRLLPHFSALS